MNTSDLNQLSEQVIKDAVFGLSILSLIIVINSVSFIKIFIWFMGACAKVVNPRSFEITFLFVASVLLMTLVHMVSILIWTMALHLNGLIENLRLAMLFAGSSYTTLGIFSDVLPTGWKSVAFYIAFSGLFSFAIATSSLISMLTLITKRLYKPVSKASVVSPKS
jgi:hypothetical protein